MRTIANTVLLITVLCLFSFAALAQGPQKTANSPSPTPPAASKSDESKPVVISREKLLEAANFDLQIQLLQEKINSAVPEEVRKKLDALTKQIQEVETARAKFFSEKIGVPQDQIASYDRSDGAGGAMILKKKAPVPNAPPAPSKQ